ncbi:MAG: hypothetical protein R3C32_12380 [Chloroflexota bacterium]
MTGAIRVLEHQLLVFRRTWQGGIFSTFLAPVLFLTAMGLGLGTFVDQANSAALRGVSYLVFLAPGLLASQAMQVASTGGTISIMSAINLEPDLPVDDRRAARGGSAAMSGRPGSVVRVPPRHRVRRVHGGLRSRSAP